MFDMKIEKRDHNSNLKKYKKVQSCLPLYGTNKCIYNAQKAY